ncbi:MAG: alpha/beta hydrolase [Acidobacteriota bacterium]
MRRRHRGESIRSHALLALLALLPVLAGCGVARGVRTLDATHRAPALHATVAGSGRPVVVLESGLGEDSGLWQRVLPLIARDTTVVAYDRAGLGRSPDRGAPRDGATMVDELRALLRAAELPPPYVLVGHSFGGLLVRIFAGRWPDEVAGLVLVDATHEDFPRIERRLRSEAELARLRTLLEMAPPAARREYEELDQTVRDVRTAGPLPDVPLVVIASGRPESDERFRTVWDRLQQDLAALSPRGRLVRLPLTTHNIPVDTPAAIAEAVHGIVLEARRRGVSGPERGALDTGGTADR